MGDNPWYLHDNHGWYWLRWWLSTNNHQLYSWQSYIRKFLNINRQSNSVNQLNHQIRNPNWLFSNHQPGNKSPPSTARRNATWITSGGLQCSNGGRKSAKRPWSRMACRWRHRSPAEYAELWVNRLVQMACYNRLILADWLNHLTLGHMLVMVKNGS